MITLPDGAVLLPTKRSWRTMEQRTLESVLARAESRYAAAAGSTPPPPHSLHGAASRGDSECLTRLLGERDYDLEAPHAGVPPLLHAIRAGWTDAAAMILARGADANAAGAALAHRWLALHCAAQREDTEAVGLLLDHGADINARGEHGVTALHVAAFNGP
eukprot:5121823-Prymnesium_polylepis.1